MKRKIILCLFALLLMISLTGCGTKKDEINNNENKTLEKQDTKEKIENKKEEKTKKEEKKEESNQNNNNNNNVVIDDEIIEFDDEDNNQYGEENVRVEKVINCDGCVFSYFSKAKTIGSTLLSDEYTKDVTKLKTSGGKQRHNFFGFVLSKNTISKAYSCILKDNKVYCIQGSTDGAYFSNNISVLNQIFSSKQCKYISNGNTYYCSDGNYNGDTRTGGYTSLHYETSCTIYGSNARTGELICH